jgi:hypothetical protein
VEREWIIQQVSQFSKDDTFRSAFLENVVITHNGDHEIELTSEARSYLYDKGTNFVDTLHVSNGEDRPSPGPYMYSNGTLRSIWKLYEDSHGAFLNTLVPDSNKQLSILHTAGSVPQSLAIAVPPRFCTLTNDQSQPLAGWRIAVKDNFQIAKVRMSACNKAYYELYPPSRGTAPCIQSLINSGAHIVGTTKLASFAATEEPIECIDWFAPWNPRADGYQSPAGSSSGSGVAVAAYEWLDITIGSDTSGSGRRPGHWNGCFAMRPTHSCLSIEGILKSFPRFDTPTFFGRELEKCKTFAKAWYGEALPSPPADDSKPFSVIYATDYMKLIGNKDQLSLIDIFVADLEMSLNVPPAKVSFEEAWTTSPPPEAHGQSMKEYMKDASRDSFFYADYHNFATFRHDYESKFNKTPYISPPVRWQWYVIFLSLSLSLSLFRRRKIPNARNCISFSLYHKIFTLIMYVSRELASHITTSAHEEALHRLEVYKEWFTSTILQPAERNTLILIPIEEISPRYRDEMPTHHFDPVGVPNLFLSPILGAPELTVPSTLPQLCCRLRDIIC